MKARDKISEGSRTWPGPSRGEQRCFPSMVVQMIGVGEQTGRRMDQNCSKKIADFLRRGKSTPPVSAADVSDRAGG